MKLPLLEWIERSVLAVWEKIADFLAKDREARKAAPEHAADPLIIIPIPKNRTYLAFFGILMLFFILAGRTFYLQVFNNDFLQNEGEKRFARTITIQGPRGEILDRNGIVLASSQPCRSVWADPALVPRSTKEEKQQLRELAKLLGIKYSELLKKLDHSSSPNFVYLARNRDLGLAEAVGALRIPGIGMSPEMRRRYPDGPAMAHIVGYTGADDHGQEGVELARDHVLAGRAGSRRVIRDRLQKELLKDVALKVEDSATTDSFRVMGRGEMHLSILIETMRREGYELQVSPPHVLTKVIDGKTYEPMEHVVIDVPTQYQGAVMTGLGQRKAILQQMESLGSDRVRLEFRMPSRGLFGYRNQFLTDTHGEGIINQIFDGYDVWAGMIANRSTGSLVSFETGEAVTYGLFNAQQRGTLLVGAGEKVYEGMVIGYTASGEDVDVNVCKTKHLTNTRASGSDDALRLIPISKLSLEGCLEFLAPDELLEVTPENLRIRKQILNHEQRMKAKSKLK